jgi:hypothetical protein
MGLEWLHTIRHRDLHPRHQPESSDYHDWRGYSPRTFEGLTEAQRIELEQLAKLPDREAFWTLFNQCVSPITTYRIEAHNLQLQPNLFKP